MASREQVLAREFLALLKRNPNVLSSVLQATQTGITTNNEQTDALNLSTNSSASSSSSTSDEESPQNRKVNDFSTVYTAEDLLAKRGAKGKGSKAQQTFRFVLRESAKKCKLWEQPPLMREISSKTLEIFIKKVISALPQLEGHAHIIRRKLSESLIFRRNQLKNTKYWKRALQINKYKDEACKRPVEKAHNTAVNTTLTVVEEALTSTLLAARADDDDDDEETGFTFKPSEELIVMDGTKKVARGTFLRPSKANSDYLKLVLQASYMKDDDEKIKLGGPNKDHKFLQDIKVGQKFYWPENQLLSKEMERKAKKRPRQPRSDPLQVSVSATSPKQDQPQVSSTSPAHATLTTASTPTATETCIANSLSLQPPVAKRYKGYVYVAIDDHEEPADNLSCETPATINGKSQRKRVPKKSLDFCYE